MIYKYYFICFKFNQFVKRYYEQLS
ncbi:hypothetical protein NMYAN_200035 [Nitrosomonas nitrosa]|uniref:Uncharacterized protein n=1 Tax=Nitrosomonas nitrosa TaxID=52442 RepID=A0A8H8Z226_9PROT|nr:hypothetical protein NMYAN_200035 [Nitrosomonas nitrosa]